MSAPTQPVSPSRPILGSILVVGFLLVSVALVTWQIFRVEHDMAQSSFYGPTSAPQAATMAVVAVALWALPVEWLVGAAILATVGDTEDLSHRSILAIVAVTVTAQPIFLSFVGFVPLLGEFALLYLVPSPAILGAFQMYKARKDADSSETYRLMRIAIGVTAIYDGLLSILAFWGVGTGLHPVLFMGDGAVVVYCVIFLLSALRRE